jgi:hypothetical protein
MNERDRQLRRPRFTLARFDAPLSGKIPNRRYNSEQRHNNSSYFHAFIEHSIFDFGGVVITVHCHRNLHLPQEGRDPGRPQAFPYKGRRLQAPQARLLSEDRPRSGFHISISAREVFLNGLIARRFDVDQKKSRIRAQQV